MINRTLVDVAVRWPDASDDLKRLGESLLVVNIRHERLIDGLLALADGEQTVLDRRPLYLIDVVDHVLDQAAAEATEREVTVQRLLDAAPTTATRSCSSAWCRTWWKMPSGTTSRAASAG